jgi:4-nitrophenyl phosphatase
MSKIAAVLLAAGGSTRFGQPKQLLDWHGKPLVAHVADVALAAGLSPLVVVLGHQADAVRAALGSRPFQVATNWRWESGLSSSVQAGLAALDPTTEAALFLLCDQPLLTPRLLRELMSRFDPEGPTIVHPVLGGARRSPTLFGRELFAELGGVTGDKGGRVLVERYPERVARVTVDKPQLLADVDTPDEYRRLLALATVAEKSPEDVLSQIRHLIIDMDGVLWQGNQPLDGLVEFFEFLGSSDIGFVLATNNASQTPEVYQQKLAGLGIEIPRETVLTSAQATAAHLSSVGRPGARVHVLGMHGLEQALSEQGFELVDKDAEYVVVGWTIDITWQKLATATLQIRQGAQFIGTNPDVTFPSEAGLVPGNGATLAALQAATGATPLIVGKPEPWLYREALQRLGAAPETTAVVGDRLDTDIAGGVRTGLTTILVLSGIATRADLVNSPIQPDLVIEGISHLADLWGRLHGV